MANGVHGITMEVIIFSKCVRQAFTFRLQCMHGIAMVSDIVLVSTCNSIVTCMLGK